MKLKFNHPLSLSEFNNLSAEDKVIFDKEWKIPKVKKLYY